MTRIGEFRTARLPPDLFPISHSHFRADVSMEQNATRPQIRIVGLQGGVASGKTFVASLLGELGAAVLDGDRAGHEVLEEPEVLAAARERWGNAVFSTDGRIDRRALGRIVFADSPQGAVSWSFWNTGPTRESGPGCSRRSKRQSSEELLWLFWTPP